MPGHKHPTQDIHDLDAKPQEAVPALLDDQQQRLDVVFPKYAGDGALADGEVLLGDGVLVGDDCGFAGEDGECGRGGRGDGVDCGDDGEEVLELVEVGGGDGDGGVEGVDEGGVEGPEGEFGDDVREVECCQYPLV
jgi:hypothetical protein